MCQIELFRQALILHFYLPNLLLSLPNILTFHHMLLWVNFHTFYQRRHHIKELKYKKKHITSHHHVGCLFTIPTFTFISFRYFFYFIFFFLKKHTHTHTFRHQIQFTKLFRICHRDRMLWRRGYLVSRISFKLYK